MSGRDLEERLLSYLRDHPGSGPREIADALGEPLQRVRLALARLRDRGLVARGEEGRYYAVAHLVKGIGRGDVRRGRPRRLVAVIHARRGDPMVDRLLYQRSRKEKIPYVRVSCGRELGVTLRRYGVARS